MDENIDERKSIFDDDDDDNMSTQPGFTGDDGADFEEESGNGLQDGNGDIPDSGEGYSYSDDSDGGEPDGGLDDGNGYSTEDGEEEGSAVPQYSPEDASKLGNSSGKNEERFNRRFFLGIGISVIFVLVLLCILKPGMDFSFLTKEKEPPKAVEVNPDFDNLEESAVTYSEPPKKKEERKDEPPAQQEPEPEPQVVVQQQAVAALEIPDTRADRLQGKAISGIKGLTSTQEKYSTDYEKTKEVNSLAAAREARLASLTSNRPSMEEYAKAMSSMAGMGNTYAVQNDQSGKQGFYNNGRGTGGEGVWLGLSTVWQGTIFEVTTTSEINTDLPGEVTARLSKNIYSSQDGRYLLIPQNSILLGQYNSSISYAQSRAQIVWHTIIRPDGYQIDLGGMNGTDAKGASGVKGFVNDHPMAYVKAIFLMSTFNLMNSGLQRQVDNEKASSFVKDVAANSQNTMNKLSEKLIERAMDVQPTIKIKAGTKMNVVVNQNLQLPAVEDFPVTDRYKRNAKPQGVH